MSLTHFSGPVDSKAGFQIDGVPVAAPNRYLSLAKKTITHDGGAAQPIVTVPANSLILDVIVHVVVGFDGTNATIDIGDVADPDRYVAAADITDISSTGYTRTQTAGYVYDAATVVQAAVTAGADATTGVAVVYVMYAKVG